MTKDYQDNNYAAFVENADDEHTLAELIDRLCGVGYEGTYMEGHLPEGNIGGQYELIKNGKATIIYDQHNQTKVFISGGGLEHFIDAARKELSDRCGEMEYDSWCAYERAMEKD
ncbi:MAG: hypothetical protein ABIA37_05230 [Candidatus Woesearchaeota archaeon]